MSSRSTEAPMDWDYTSRSQAPPAWRDSQTDGSTPKKRPLESSAGPPHLGSPTPNFGANHNVPFIFNTEPPPPPEYPWAPPVNFTPSKIFQAEVKDVDMSEASPSQPEEGRAIAVGGMRRVYNARRRKAMKEQLGEDSDDESVTAVTQNTSNHYTLNMPSPRPDLPYVLSGYLQFFFNLSLILLFLYLVVQFILTVQRDVAERISEHSFDMVQEIAMCSQEYKKNYCGTDRYSPALEKQCSLWEACMNRDPSIVGRARVGAELIAEVVNGFVEPISWKTLVRTHPSFYHHPVVTNENQAFTLTSLSFLTVFINSLFSLYRSRHSPSAPSHPPPPSAPYPPHYAGYLQPAAWDRSWPGAQEEDVQSPPRRRRLEGGASVKIK
ncbi:hypothetical protein HGRIS_014721 [Hohenbuehelia grisea]|uniref:Brl1/Brr6 domain-containing protein n=1 Tax=Hohenbuehelia grisea TaxID=104357 RepID=A0ABR3IQI9_9AGAR